MDNKKREEIPPEIKRGAGRRLFVDFQARFPDGSAFRRTKDFDAAALKPALDFLERAKADFARGNGVGAPELQDDVLTVGAWCEYCLSTAMPAQRNGAAPKYSNEMLVGFREVVRRYITPKIGKVPLEELNKKMVTEFVATLASDEIRAKTLNVLVRAMEIAEGKGKRKKGTNPCKGVSNVKPRPGVTKQSIADRYAKPAEPETTELESESPSDSPPTESP